MAQPNWHLHGFARSLGIKKEYGINITVKDLWQAKKKKENQSGLIINFTIKMCVNM